ncbi:uncharacterized protein N7479_001669 [Penicillium vulpinum]|uniref:uncharacterized protein n=1 Tax=Penicillium vulpinum TaxID=29845 RepID=UPI0025471F13|nr:uncharacterized protein N7479_001669 [Penicillium vulpinum]KAJ5971751.1 hypothetical protein N7479_001669 [Penicillium vulpinum]
MSSDKDFCVRQSTLVWLLGTREVKRAIKRQHKPNARTASLVVTCQALRKYRYLLLGETQSLGQKQTAEGIYAPYSKQAHYSCFGYAFPSRLAF